MHFVISFLRKRRRDFGNNKLFICVAICDKNLSKWSTESRWPNSFRTMIIITNFHIDKSSFIFDLKRLNIDNTIWFQGTVQNHLYAKSVRKNSENVGSNSQLSFHMKSDYSWNQFKLFLHSWFAVVQIWHKSSIKIVHIN